jgi:hypothetical protein
VIGCRVSASPDLFDGSPWWLAGGEGPDAHRVEGVNNSMMFVRDEQASEFEVVRRRGTVLARGAGPSCVGRNVRIMYTSSMGPQQRPGPEHAGGSRPTPVQWVPDGSPSPNGLPKRRNVFGTDGRMLPTTAGHGRTEKDQALTAFPLVRA